MPAVSFIQFFFDLFFIFALQITNKLQPLPCKVSRKFIEGCGDYLIILVQHEPSISHV